MSTPARHSISIFAVVAISALLAVLPMLVRGPSCGHDFDFHLLSWLEAANQFAHLGVPHWAFTPAFNAGEPRFVFYPPLSWTLGALLGLALPWPLVPAAFTWVALAASGLTMHAFARRFLSPAAALLAAVLYLANPYMLFTAYERTAYGELLAAAWLPLLFAAALAPRVRIIAIAIPVALLWLTNAPAAVMSCYALAFLTAIRLLVLALRPAARPSLPSSLLPLACTSAAGTLLGLALSAFYLLPAAYERRFVQIDMAVIPGMRVSDHFLFHRMSPATPDNAFHDTVVRTASLLALLLLAAIAAALLIAWRSRPPSIAASSSVPHSSQPHRDEWETLPPILPLALLTLLIGFLLTPVSLPLWTHLPELAFLQFPWRLMALLGVIFALTVALALTRLTPHLPLPSSLLPLPCLILILPAWHLFQQRCDVEDSVPARVALFHSNLGTEPTDEYTPIGADPDALHPHDPPFWLLKAGADPNDPAPMPAPPGQAPTHLTLTIDAPEILVLNRRDFPSWQISVNQTPAAELKRSDGLIAVSLPPGTDTIDLTPIRPRDRSAGLALSLLAALSLALQRKGRTKADTEILASPE